jgi:hypothetical protein
MANDETMMMTQFGIRYKGGFGPGSPKWSFPNCCACCGAQSQGAHPVKLRHESATRKYSLKVNVPYCATCMGHVQARAHEQNIANAIAGVIAVIVALVVANAMRPIHSPTDILEYSRGQTFGFIMAGVVAFALLQIIVVKLFFGAAGRALPRSESCTMPLESRLTGGPGRGDLDVAFISANTTFTERFREANRQVIEEEAAMIGKVSRTPRGDARFVSAQRATGSK